MKLKSRKIISLALVFFMMLTILPMAPVTAHAATGAGTESDPLYVTTFAELKAALESAEDTYIVVEEFKNTTGLSYYDYSNDYEDNGFAIKVPANYTKHLTVNKAIKLHTSTTAKVCYALIGNAGNLTIQGSGSISVNFNNGQHETTPGAIVYNQYPGVLTVKDSVTLNANDLQVTAPMRSDPIVIYNYSGTVDIYGGTFKAYGTSDLAGYQRSTVAVVNRGDKAAKMNIYGGTFSATNIVASLVNYGLSADNGVKLYGGVFHGIKVDDTTTLNAILASNEHNYIDTSDNTVYYPDDARKETTQTLRVRNNTLYDITVDGGTANPSKAYAGDTVTLTADAAPSGKVFDKWKVVSGDIEVSGNTFEMPANNVSLKATYKTEPVITSVSAAIDAPEIDENVNGDYSVTLSSGSCPSRVRYWYEGDSATGPWTEKTGGTFVAGKYYKAVLYVNCDSASKFTAETEATVNGDAADKELVSDTQIKITKVWGPLGGTESSIVPISSVAATIDAPELDAFAISRTYGAIFDGKFTASIQWMESESGASGSWESKSTTPFEVNKYYRAILTLVCHDTHKFTDSTSVTVNGGSADKVNVMSDSVMQIEKIWEPLTAGGDTPECTHENMTLVYEDGTGHWSECTAEGCEYATEKVPHVFETDEDTTCECGYTRTIEGGDVTPPECQHPETEVKYDADGHWTECKAEDCDYATEKVPHVFETDEDTTCECGYTRTISSGSSSGGGFSGSYNYPVIVGDTDGADVAVSDDYAVKGEKITITVKPDAGEQVDEVIVTDKDGKVIPVTKTGDNEYTFTMPASKVTVDVATEAADYGLRIVMQINNKNILVNGVTKVNDVAPVIVGDRTLVPIRVVTELLGGSAHWDNATRTVTLKIDGKVLSMTIGKPIPGFGTSAVIMNDRTYVPVRYVMEKLGAEVEWINATQQIIIEK